MAANAVVFWVLGPGNLTPASPTQTMPFLPVWYALDVLIPVDLGWEKHWRPVGIGMTRWIAVQGFLGWVLVPLVVAQIAGLLKKRG